MSLYDCVSADQVNSTKALLKILRYMHVCGILDLEVTSKSSEYAKRKLLSMYRMRATAYRPDQFITDVERLEKSWMESLKFHATVSS